jgi:hypothetical protein
VIRALLTLALVLVACGGAKVNPDNTTAASMWCFAGTAPGAQMVCATDKGQCERDRDAAVLDRDTTENPTWTSVSPCRSSVVAVHLRAPDPPPKE